MPYRRPGVARSGALLIIAAVVPVLVFAGFTTVGVYGQRQAEIRERAIGEARRLAEAVDRELAATLDSAQMLTVLPALDAPVDAAAFGEVARREQARHDLWLTVLLFDPSGRRLVNSRTPERLGGAVEPESLTEVIRARRPLVGAIAKGPGEYGIPFRAPVVRNGAVTGVVTVVARPDGIGRLLVDAGLPAEWIVTIVDRNDHVVARSQNLSAYVGKPASERARRARAEGDSGIYDGATLDGVRTVSAFWQSPETGWSVHIGIPRERLEAPLNRSILLTAAGSLLSLLLAGLFASLLLRELRLRRRESLALEQTYRMEALGRLTGGVAHDFNNLLMIIQGNAETLQRRLTAENARRPLAAIREATERASRLTRELLVFARGGSIDRKVVDLNGVIQSFLEAAQQAVGPGVLIEAEFASDAGAVEVDRVQLELALLNLAVNARDAMEGSGRLTISTVRVGPDKVEVRVADTGPGVAPAIAGRVFDPFFTTKPAGAGTGLGLTQVYSFAQQSGGAARIDTVESGGAVVVIQLPISSRTPEADEVAAETVPLDLKGRSILLLDDNIDVRAVSAEHLRELGAEVAEASSAAEGLVALGRDRFDLVISDIVMPGALDGLQLAERIREGRPGQAILLVSGYSASTAEALTRGFRVVRKPFSLRDLDVAIAELLPDRSRTGHEP